MSKVGSVWLFIALLKKNKNERLSSHENTHTHARARVRTQASVGWIQFFVCYITFELFNLLHMN